MRLSRRFTPRNDGALKTQIPNPFSKGEIHF